MSSEIKYKNLIIQLLTVLFPTATIYLFGSYARGTQTESSDIDIAIDDKHEISHYDIARAKRVLEALYIPYKFDVIDFFSVPDELQQEIIEEGIIWKEGKNT